MKQTKNLLKNIAVFVFWLLIWQIAAIIANQEILIPSPLSTLLALFDLGKNPQFYLAILFSLLRIISGFLLGVLVGIIGAVLAHSFGIINKTVTPLLKIIRAVPVASFIILALVWFKSPILPIFIAFTTVLPIIWTETQDALQNTDKRYIEMGKIFRLSGFKILFDIKLPFARQTIISTSLTALGFAWKSGIAAEVICMPVNSLGGLLQEAKLYILTPEVFAITAVIAILSLLLEAFIRKLLRRFTHD